MDNKKVSNAHTFISKLFSSLFHMNPKNNLNFDKLKKNLCIAIKQEKELAQKNKDLADQIGSNIGILIQNMRMDPRDKIMK